nr:alpha/beta hydrolase [Acidimicrobiia bacterium]
MPTVEVDPVLKTLLDQLAALGGPGVETMTPDDARANYQLMVVMAGAPEEVASAVDGEVAGVPVRTYRPAGGDPVGTLAWFHGGGWVIGNLESADATCRKLCRGAGVVVVSVDYRLAPEHPYPAGLEDAWAGLEWVAANAAVLGVDGERLAVGGDSAGGNLAALVALRARDLGAPILRHQLLVYPATDLRMGHPSIAENGDGYFLTREAMSWFADHYLGPDRSHGDPADPAVSPLLADDLLGVAPGHVITAELDPLRDEGDAYAARLADAGVAVA